MFNNGLMVDCVVSALVRNSVLINLLHLLFL